jgi:hypothetical protein
MGVAAGEHSTYDLDTENERCNGGRGVQSYRSHRVAMRLETGFPLGKLAAANVVTVSEGERRSENRSHINIHKLFTPSIYNAVSSSTSHFLIIPTALTAVASSASSHFSAALPSFNIGLPRRSDSSSSFG